jgi:hypothetical protein
LRHHLAFAISHVLDHGFGLLRLLPLQSALTFAALGGNGGIGEGSDSGCHDQSINDTAF